MISLFRTRIQDCWPTYPFDYLKFRHYRRLRFPNVKYKEGLEDTPDAVDIDFHERLAEMRRLGCHKRTPICQGLSLINHSHGSLLR